VFQFSYDGTVPACFLLHTVQYTTPDPHGQHSRPAQRFSMFYLHFRSGQRFSALHNIYGLMQYNRARFNDFMWVGVIHGMWRHGYSRCLTDGVIFDIDASIVNAHKMVKEK
jgi:hypothetical protein